LLLGRPLSGLSTFLAAIGARFARSRSGEGVATVLRAFSRPLPAAFGTLDR
jgi:hypothetical protein